MNEKHDDDSIVNRDEEVEDEETGLYVMSIAAELVGTHPQTLREYERRGLVSPKRTGGGNRRFANSDIARLKRIKTLRDEGMSLTAITQLLEYERALFQLQQENEELKTTLEDTQVRLDDVENRLAQVEETIDTNSTELVRIVKADIVLSRKDEER